MLVSPPHHQLSSFLDSHNLCCRSNCNIKNTSLVYYLVPNTSSNPKPSLPVVSSSIASSHQIVRKHNARTTALLLRHLSQPQPKESTTKEEEEEEALSIPAPWQQEEEMTEEEKVKLLEISLVKRRTPQFAGSIYLQSHLTPEGRNSPPPLHRLFQGGPEDVDDDKMLMRALEIRRRVTAEIFKEAMRAGKFRTTFSTNLVSWSPDFIDHIMIQAASLKRSHEFSHSTFNIRAKTVIQNSNVIPLIRWLKHNSLTYPQIGKLICMTCENLGLIRQKIEWLKTIHVKGEFLGLTLVRAGGGIMQRSIQELDEIVSYLESNGVRREWIGFVVSRCPPLLGYTIEELRLRVNFYLDMGMNEKDFGTMVFDYPKALGFFTLEEMDSKVHYLKEFGLNNEDIGRLLAIKPQLMACSIEERWKPLVKYFNYLGVRQDGMKRILIVKPIVFCVDLETTIAPKVQFLQDIGICEEEVGSMLVRFPHLLIYSLHKKIRPVIIFLITKAGVARRDIGKVISLGPELLGCNIANKLEVNVKYFLSLGIPLSLLGKVIADFPMLLRYNLDVLRPKYSYLRRTMGRPLQDLIDFPRFFSYSLDGRIIPRHKIMVECRINLELCYMLECSDDEFNQRVEAAVQRCQNFESSVSSHPLSNFHAFK